MGRCHPVPDLVFHRRDIEVVESEQCGVVLHPRSDLLTKSPAAVANHAALNVCGLVADGDRAAHRACALIVMHRLRFAEPGQSARLRVVDRLAHWLHGDVYGEVVALGVQVTGQVE
jgi:hypothetical protein